jgi:Mg2+ and Co2+ transporter CorA
MSAIHFPSNFITGMWGIVGDLLNSPFGTLAAIIAGASLIIFFFEVITNPFQ